MIYKDIINKVSKDLNIDERIVDTAYKAYWKSIKEMIQQLPLKDTLTEEDFSQLGTNFNIPSLGKLTCTYDRYQKMKQRYEYIKKNIKYDNES